MLDASEYNLSFLSHLFQKLLYDDVASPSVINMYINCFTVRKSFTTKRRYRLQLQEDDKYVLFYN